jgi:NADPH:quinone reductase-like Zn-dependent oxidoreductase
MDENKAAFLIGFGRKPLDVDEAESRFADENEIVIKNAAISINPVDIDMQSNPWGTFSYPLVMGADVAGEVVEVGSDVTRFSVGDRVLGHALQLATNDDRHGSFQHYVVLLPNMASAIPPSLSYESAAVLPLGISTASAALFQDEMLGLDAPALYPQKKDEWVIVTGATGNVGSHGVRLAAAAGYKVLALASLDKFELAKKLGATGVLNSRPTAPQTLSDMLVQELSGKTIAGAFDATAADNVLGETAKAVGQLTGKKVVTSVIAWVDPKIVPTGVKVKAVMAVNIRLNSVSKMVYEDFLPDALAMGKYVLYPEPFVSGEGLDSIQAAMEKKAPVGQKVVVVIK